MNSSKIRVAVGRENLDLEEPGVPIEWELADVAVDCNLQILGRHQPACVEPLIDN